MGESFERDFCYDVTYIRPPVQTVRVEIDGEAGQPVGTGVLGQFFLAGNRMVVLHLRQLALFGGKSY